MAHAFIQIMRTIMSIYSNIIEYGNPLFQTHEREKLRAIRSQRRPHRPAGACQRHGYRAFFADADPALDAAGRGSHVGGWRLARHWKLCRLSRRRAGLHRACAAATVGDSLGTCRGGIIDARDGTLRLAAAV